jgi:uncharacterized protein YukE
MTTLHLQTEAGYETASALKQNTAKALEEAQALQQAIRILTSAWQGGGQVEFSHEATVLANRIQEHIFELQSLAERLQREVQEWEEVDKRGASSLRGTSSFSLQQAYAVPYTGGLGFMPSYNRAILPIFTAVSVAPLMQGMSAWVNGLLDRFFPKPGIVSPLPETPSEPSGFGKLLQESPQASPSAQAAPPPSSSAQSEPVPLPLPSEGYDIYHDLPPKSQGALYGSAACLPTSMSMVLDHYHSQDAANASASPNDLIGMLDQGDGTFGRGITLDRMNDDLAELGYESKVSSSDMDGLSNALQDGPVIVNSKVGLVSSPARDITPNGSTNHAIVVKAISADSVVVNDPWSGAEKTFPRDTFEKIWSGGGNYMIVVRPDGSAR